MNTTPENERHQLIRSIFQKLDADEPVEAMNIRDAFYAVWDRLFYLGEYLESAASQFEGSERSFLLEEQRRMKTAMAIVSESYLPVIMPDETNVGP